MAQYPALHRAFRSIALDNGGINWTRSAERQEREARAFLAKRDSALLEPIEAWLSSLSEDDLETVCNGGANEPETLSLMTGAPPFADAILNEYFEEVC